MPKPIARKLQLYLPASRHERGWIVDSLGGFYEHRWLDDVIRLVKGGKEANVYQCWRYSVDGLDSPTWPLRCTAAAFPNLKNDHCT